MIHTLIQKSFGGMESEPMHFKEKILSTRGTEGSRTRDTAEQRAQHTTDWAILTPDTRPTSPSADPVTPGTWLGGSY